MRADSTNGAGNEALPPPELMIWQNIASHYRPFFVYLFLFISSDWPYVYSGCERGITRLSPRPSVFLSLTMTEST